ncbi:hypothetical protein Gpo141_00009394 [Globisporangium polare]
MATRRTAIDLSTLSEHDEHSEGDGDSERSYEEETGDEDGRDYCDGRRGGYHECDSGCEEERNQGPLKPTPRIPVQLERFKQPKPALHNPPLPTSRALLPQLRGPPNKLAPLISNRRESAHSKKR